MVTKLNMLWVQTGILSFGGGCPRTGLPEVFTRVSRYEAWINDQIDADLPAYVPFISTGMDPDNVTCPTPNDTTTVTDIPSSTAIPLGKTGHCAGSVTSE